MFWDSVSGTNNVKLAKFEKLQKILKKCYLLIFTQLRSSIVLLVQTFMATSSHLGSRSFSSWCKTEEWARLRVVSWLRCACRQRVERGSPSTPVPSDTDVKACTTVCYVATSQLRRIGLSSSCRGDNLIGSINRFLESGVNRSKGQPLQQWVNTEHFKTIAASAIVQI